jgi:hypothetical protein
MAGARKGKGSRRSRQEWRSLLAKFADSDLGVEASERVNDFASPCFMNLLSKEGCLSRRFSPLRVG